MSADEVLLAALEASFASLDPASAGADRLRVHLAGQYLAAARPERALELVEEVLTGSPEDEQALAVGASAAAALGLHARADELRDVQARLLGLSAGNAPESDARPARAALAQPAVESDDWPVDRDRITLNDVFGMEDAKRRLTRSFLGPLRNRAVAEAFATDLRGGLLLWGPPGTGKTFLARAVAGELGAAFLSATPADIYDSYFGESESNIARLFREARSAAPAVVFLDEIDALGGRRSTRHTDQARGVVNQLLTELDGMESNRGVFVLAATNAPWDVDGALRRPGRFDRTVCVLPPDAPARAALLAYQLSQRPSTPGMNVSSLVARTETYTGADLVRLVANAAEHALERSIELGVTSPVTEADLALALADTSPSAREWFAQAANYIAYSRDRGDYDELQKYLRKNRLT